MAVTPEGELEAQELSGLDLGTIDTTTNDYRTPMNPEPPSTEDSWVCQICQTPYCVPTLARLCEKKHGEYGQTL